MRTRALCFLEESEGAMVFIVFILVGTLGFIPYVFAQGWKNLRRWKLKELRGVGQVSLLWDAQPRSASMGWEYKYRREIYILLLRGEGKLRTTKREALRKIFISVGGDSIRYQSVLVASWWLVGILWLWRSRDRWLPKDDRHLHLRKHCTLMTNSISKWGTTC